MCFVSAVSCRDPRVTHRLLNVSAWSFPNSVNITCPYGYWLPAESSVIRCSSSGRWIPQPKNCTEVFCPPLPNITDGIVTVPDFRVGSQANFTCLVGYNLSNRQPGRTCMQDKATGVGYWSGSSPVCNIVTCPFPGDIQNGIMKIHSLKLSSQITYSCNLGFALTVGHRHRECLSNGQWSGPTPQCIGKMQIGYNFHHQWSLLYFLPCN